MYIRLFRDSERIILQTARDRRSTEVTFRPASPLQRIVEALEDRPLIILAILTALYALMLCPFAARPLWHDELYTFYIANAPTPQRALEEVRTLDLNPPLLYLLTRLSNALLGMSPLATRVPSLFAFYGFSIFLFAFVRRRLSNLFSAVTVMLFWSGYFFYYAMEARPYALLLFFSGLTLISYDHAIFRWGRKAALAGIAAGIIGMLLSHVFAPFTIAPFFIAEAYRSFRNRKPDWPLWAVLALPLAAAAIDIPLVQHFHGLIFPAAFQPSVPVLFHFYWLIGRRSIFGYLAVILGGVAGAAAGFSAGRRAGWKPTDFALGAVFAVMPVVLGLVLLRTHGAFWERYCITTAAALSVIAGALLAKCFRQNKEAAFGSFAVLLAVLLVSKVAKPFYTLRSELPNASILEAIRPDLPLVSASGITFLEMDNHESSSMTHRLYYLLDPAAAMRYAHSSLFDGFAILKRDYFPIRSNIETFGAFTSEHHRFLVLSRPDYPENWLLPKLKDDGATIREAGSFQLPYPDKELYEVNLRNTAP